MVYLKEDGSLDVERINSLSIEEFCDTIGNLTQAQRKEYVSHLPINESDEPKMPIIVWDTLENELKKGSVIAEDLINNLRKKRMKKI